MRQPIRPIQKENTHKNLKSKRNNNPLLENKTFMWGLKYYTISLFFILCAALMWAMKSTITTTLNEITARVLILFFIFSAILCLIIVTSTLALFFDEIAEQKIYSWLTFGKFNRTYQKRIDSIESCDVCFNKTKQGINIIHYSEKVVFGFRIQTNSFRAYIFCSNCYY